MIKYRLKFTPTPRSDHVELKLDIKKFCRKLRLIEYTADTDGNSNDISLEKNPSTFTPEAHRDVILDMYIDFISKYLFEEILRDQNKSRPNLRQNKWQALLELKEDKNLVRKECDKGGACVIMDKQFYCECIFVN